MPGFELIGKEERDAVLEVFEHQNGVLFRDGFDALRNGHFKVAEFEKLFAEHIGTSHAVAVSSGTAAIKVALKALGVGPGDEVITQAFTFVATVEAIVDCGAVPVLTNIDATLNMDPEDLGRKIASKTKAILPVHMLGVAADLGPICDIARQASVPIIEENCESLGGKYDGKWLGTLGRMGVFSFDFGKALTTGEGGMVVTNDERLYRRAREYQDHGHENNPALARSRDTRTLCGFNFRMTELQGAVGLAQLGKLDAICEANRRNHTRLMAGLREINGIQFRSIPPRCEDLCDTIIFYLPDVKKAQAFAYEMGRKGLGTKNLPDAYDWHFAGCWDHIFTALGVNKNELQKIVEPSQRLLERSIALPVMVRYEEKQIAQIVAALREIAHFVFD